MVSIYLDILSKIQLRLLPVRMLQKEKDHVIVFIEDQNKVKEHLK